MYVEIDDKIKYVASTVPTTSTCHKICYMKICSTD